jgi:hypothetical protein
MEHEIGAKLKGYMKVADREIIFYSFSVIIRIKLCEKFLPMRIQTKLPLFLLFLFFFFKSTLHICTFF